MKKYNCIWIVICYVLASNVSGADERVNFVVMGDMPYTQKDKVTLVSLQDAIPQLEPMVLVHYGDLISGNESCTDSLLKQRREQIVAFSPQKVIYTMGDNEWTDCDRKHLEKRFSELERLRYLRSIFYDDKSLNVSGDITGLVRQKEQPENSLWKIKGLLMGTLHIVGTNNGRVNILKNNVNTTLDEVDKRDTHNISWLQNIFYHAKDAEAVVIIFHADIYRFKGDAPACTKENRLQCNPYKTIRDMLKRLAKEYKKPVLVVHGDTHPYCFNQPYDEVPNFWHFNGPGDFKVSDAANIIFNPKDKNRPFEIHGVLHTQTPPLVCNYNRSK